MGSTNNDTTVIPMRFVKGDKRDGALVVWEALPLYTLLSYKKTRCRGGGESNVSMNPDAPCLGYNSLVG